MIILHIGRHKTGTSAVQHVLTRNRMRLRRAGWDYPRALSGRAAHHDFVAGLLAGAAGVADNPHNREVARMTAWLQTPGDKIVSSEAFQNLDPEQLRGVFPVGQTRVLVYLREPLDYLISSYAQTIQAQAVHTAFIRYAAAFRPDYAAFLDKWAAVFGHDAIEARLYDRAELVQGDIVQDFVAAVGLPGDQLQFPPQHFNPSIGPELIEFKGVINTFVPAEKQAAMRLYPRLARLAKRFPQRMRVPSAFAQSYRARFAASNAEVFARYLGRPGETFAEKDLAGEPPAVDPVEITVKALKLLARRSPKEAAAIWAMMPSDLSGVEPLLPTDWDAALRALERSSPKPSTGAAPPG